MASTAQQVTLTVAKQGAVFHGLALLILQDPPQSAASPSMMCCLWLFVFNFYCYAV